MSATQTKTATDAKAPAARKPTAAQILKRFGSELIGLVRFADSAELRVGLKLAEVEHYLRHSSAKSIPTLAEWVGQYLPDKVATGPTGTVSFKTVGSDSVYRALSAGRVGAVLGLDQDAEKLPSVSSLVECYRLLSKLRSDTPAEKRTEQEAKVLEVWGAATEATSGDFPTAAEVKAVLTEKYPDEAGSGGSGSGGSGSDDGPAIDAVAMQAAIEDLTAQITDKVQDEWKPLTVAILREAVKIGQNRGWEMRMKEGGVVERCPECGEVIYALTGRSTYRETRSQGGRLVTTSHEVKAECKNGHEWILDEGHEEIEKPPATELVPSP